MIKSTNFQIGISNTETQNFSFSSNNDGTVKLARGNIGATTQDVMTVDSNGVANFPQGAGTMIVRAAKPTTSGTFIDFSPTDGTGIPSWANRVSISLYKVSTNGTSVPQIQLGTSGGIVSTGYDGAIDSQNTGGGITASITSGIGLIRSGAATAAQLITGRVVFERQTGNTWVGTFIGGATGGLLVVSYGMTNISLSGPLDRIRLTTVNGTDTFDSGSITVFVEG